jgi:hypothetical protein
MDINRLLILIVTFIFGCKNNENLESKIQLNPKNFNRNVDFQSLFTQVEILPIMNEIDTSIWFGEITQYKTYGDIIYLLDENQSKSITGIDKLGNVKFQFKNVGDGEGEYRAIYAFTVDTEINQLVIYERSKGQLMVYKLGDFSFVKSIKLQDYLSNIEFLKGNKILCFTEGETLDDNTMVYSLDLNTEEKVSLFKTQYDGIRENFLPFNYNYSQEILALPFKEEIWKWNSEAQEFILEYGINLKGQEYPEKLLRSREVLDLHDFYINNEYLFYLNNYAEVNNVGYGFFYAGFADRAFFKLAKQTKEIELYDWLDLFDNESMPLPNNFYEGQYVAISYLNSSTYKELIQEFPQNTSNNSNAISSNIEQAYIFKYKIK